jgi:hypothetical protein
MVLTLQPLWLSDICLCDFSTFFSILCLQVVCAKYGIGVESSSQIDRRALNYLINYYLNISIHGCPPKVVFHFCQSFLLQCQFMPSSLCSSFLSNVLNFFMFLVRKHFLIVERNCSVAMNKILPQRSPAVHLAK